MYRRAVLFGYALQQTMERHWLEGLFHTRGGEEAAAAGSVEAEVPTLAEFVDAVLDVREEAAEAAEHAQVRVQR